MTDGQITALAQRHIAEIIDYALEVEAWTHDDLPALTLDDYERVMTEVRRITTDLITSAGQTGHDAWWWAHITSNGKEVAWGEPPAHHT